MVKNNFEVDVKVKCIEADMTQTKLGEEVGTTGQYVNRLIKKGDSCRCSKFSATIFSLPMKNARRSKAWIRST